MAIWRRAVSVLLATALTAAIPISGLAKSNSTSPASPQASPQSSPWVSDWQKGDPTSQDNTYQIYPTPQQITYPETGDGVTLSGAVQVSVGTGVSQETKDYLSEVLADVGCTASFVPDNGANAKIHLGIQNDTSPAQA